MKKPLRRLRINSRFKGGFTIVELLVVVVIIAVLAAISLVMYSGISQKAVASVLQSDLSNASTALKAFQVENGNYPTTISTDCNVKPDTTTNKCLKASNGNTYLGYYANNSTTPKTFQLVASSGSQLYRLTSDTAPAQLASATMQPGTTPGAIVELHAARANGGTSQGINGPLTTAWYDTSSNGNNGTLASFTGSPWSGSGTIIDPYKLSFDGVDDYVLFSDLSTAESKMFTYEVWFKLPTQGAAAYKFLVSEAGVAPLSMNNMVGLTMSSGTVGTVRFFYRLSDTTGPSGLTTPLRYDDDTWHHAVGVSDGTNAYIYMDGALTNGPAVIPAADLQINRTRVGASGQNQYYWAGGIAIARIYPFALTAAQVTANYNAGSDW